MHPMTAPGPRSWAHGSGGQLRAVWRISAFVSVSVLSLGIVTALMQQLLSVVGPTVGGMLSPADLINAIGTFAAVAFVLHSVDSQSWSAIGLQSASWKLPKLANGTAFGTLAIVATCALLVASGNLQFEHDANWTLTIGDVVTTSPGSAWLLATLRISLLLAPAALYEELIFRGYLWRVCVDSANPTVAIVVTSILFGFAHLQNPGVDALAIGNVILAGFALGIVRQRTGSLPAAIAAHMSWNWVMAAALHVQVSGQALSTPGYRTIPHGASWISGGDWGPEGGFVASIVLLALVAYGIRKTSFEKQIPQRTHDRFTRSVNGAH
ncbi:MAG: type II CAAX endopeptidase family protein [Gemmatimonadaceae bacterium]